MINLKQNKRLEAAKYGGFKQLQAKRRITSIKPIAISRLLPFDLPPHGALTPNAGIEVEVLSTQAGAEAKSVEDLSAFKSRQIQSRELPRSHQ